MLASVENHNDMALPCSALCLCKLCNCIVSACLCIVFAPCVHEWPGQSAYFRCTWALVQDGQHIHVCMTMQARRLLLLHLLLSQGRIVIDSQDAWVLRASDIKGLQFSMAVSDNHTLTLKAVMPHHPPQSVPKISSVSP